MKVTIFNSEINEIIDKKISEKKSEWDRVVKKLKIMREEIANLIVEIDIWELSNKDKTPEFNTMVSNVTERVAKYNEYKDNHKELAERLDIEIAVLEDIKAKYPIQ